MATNKYKLTINKPLDGKIYLEKCDFEYDSCGIHRLTITIQTDNNPQLVINRLFLNVEEFKEAINQQDILRAKFLLDEMESKKLWE